MDNTTLNPGTAGDAIRDIDRLSAGVKTQVVQLDFGGSAANPEQLVSQTNALPVSLAASTFVFSTVNTTVVQLAPGQSFLGTIEAIPNQPGISILLTSDQPVAVYVQQFIDAAGLFQVPDLTPTPAIVPASKGMSLSFPANGNYARVKITNVGPNATTTLNLNTAYGNIDPATTLGNQPVAINEIGGIAIAGALPVVGTLAVNNFPGGQRDTLSPDTPDAVRLVGRSDGDFAGIDLIEALMDDGSGLSANVRVVNPQKTDVNNALILSDAPAPIVLQGAANSVLIIDTMGYQSLNITGAGMGATLSTSNDGVSWAALTGTNNILGSQATALLSTNSYSFPCLARYMRFVVTTAGRATAYLRTAPWIAGYTTTVMNVSSGTTNISSLGGVTVPAVTSSNSGIASSAVAGAVALQVASMTGAGGAADVASSARTTTGVSATIQDTLGGALSAAIVVSAVTGTTPTLDIVLQESPDLGTTWVDVYHCERAIANGTLMVPSVPINGLRRWSWTIGGTTPSFTFAISPVRGGMHPYPRFVQFFDRTAGLLNGTLNATSSTYTTAGCKTITASITIGAATTGGIYKLQGSMDGTNFYDISGTVTAVASSTVQITNTAGVIARFVRLFVSTGAVAQTGTVVGITGTN